MGPPVYTEEWMPVSGAWTTGLGHAYRIRSKVWGVVTTTPNGKVCRSVVSALEEGVQRDSHMAFALVNFMELIGEEACPNFRLEASSYLTEAQRGLPLMQQYVRTEHGATWSGDIGDEFDEGGSESEASETEVSKIEEEIEGNNGSAASPLLTNNDG